MGVHCWGMSVKQGSTVHQYSHLSKGVLISYSSSILINCIWVVTCRCAGTGSTSLSPTPSGNPNVSCWDGSCPHPLHSMTALPGRDTMSLVSASYTGIHLRWARLYSPLGTICTLLTHHYMYSLLDLEAYYHVHGYCRVSLSEGTINLQMMVQGSNK